MKDKDKKELLSFIKSKKTMIKYCAEHH